MYSCSNGISTASGGTGGCTAGAGLCTASSCVYRWTISDVCTASSDMCTCSIILYLSRLLYYIMITRLDRYNKALAVQCMMLAVMGNCRWGLHA